MRPRVWWLMATVLAVALFVTLGCWQWQRGQHRLALQAQFAAGGTAALRPGGRDLATLPRFTRVELHGRYDPRHQFLLDNMIEAGRPGYHVLTPLILADGRVLLVNRGWMPFTGYRERLPDVAFAAPDPLTLRGRLDQLPTAGLASGRAPPPLQGPWPRLTTFPHSHEIARALEGTLEGRALQPQVLLLDADQPHGYLRNWRPPGLPPQRHIAYAVQWWAFAALAAVLPMVLNRLRKT